MIRLLIFLLILVTMVACGRQSIVDDDTYFGITTTDKPSYTYWDHAECYQLCQVPCTRTVVHFKEQQIDMYNCVQLKIINTSFMENLKGGSFRNAIIIIVVVTFVIMILIACGYYCCCNRKDDDDDRYPGRDEFRPHFSELGPREERKALNKGSAVIQV
uniref:CX domain-containing protein n=1 Tax=Caenorhabditis tropicalis TaxID=1561998 RepID=A0A1I7U082_9PELO